jgi:hypothetical protein
MTPMPTARPASTARSQILGMDLAQRAAMARNVQPAQRFQLPRAPAGDGQEVAVQPRRDAAQHTDHRVEIQLAKEEPGGKTQE